MNRLGFTSALALIVRGRSRNSLCASNLRTTRGVFGARRRTRTLSPVVLTEQQPPAPTSTTSLPTNEEIDPGAVPGTSLRVMKYPHPALRAPNTKVSDDERTNIRTIAREMLLVMYASRGVGLAAPQVGVNKRLMVFNVEGDAKKWTHETILVNPRIIGQSRATDVEAEACLSFPGMSGPVRRAEWVKVEATRPNGKRFTVRYEGWKARVFQHEYDHLDGVLYVDHLDEDARTEVQPVLDTLVERYNATNSAPPAL